MVIHKKQNYLFHFDKVRTESNTEKGKLST